MVYWPSAVVVAVRLVPRTTTRASTSGCPAAVTLPVTVAWAWSAAGAAANASNANIACRFLHGFLVRTTDMVILGLSPGGGSRDAGESPASAGREWEGGRGGMARGRNSMRSTRRRLVRVTCRVASRSQRVLVPGIGRGEVCTRRPTNDSINSLNSCSVHVGGCVSLALAGDSPRDDCAPFGRRRSAPRCEMASPRYLKFLSTPYNISTVPAMTATTE